MQRKVHGRLCGQVQTLEGGVCVDRLKTVVFTRIIIIMVAILSGNLVKLDFRVQANSACSPMVGPDEMQIYRGNKIMKLASFKSAFGVSFCFFNAFAFAGGWTVATKITSVGQYGSNSTFFTTEADISQ